MDGREGILIWLEDTGCFAVQPGGLDRSALRCLRDGDRLEVWDPTSGTYHPGRVRQGARGGYYWTADGEEKMVILTRGRRVRQPEPQAGQAGAAPGPGE